MLSVLLPIPDMEVSLIAVVALGAAVGVLGGLLGVGGGFILTPMLNVLFGIPYNVAVGSSLSQIAGMSASAVVKHRGLGNVDFRLGAIMIVTGCVGLEGGVRVLELLKGYGSVAILGCEISVLLLVMSIIYIVLLVGIGTGVLRESVRAIRKERAGEDPEPGGALAAALRRINLPPMISLPTSGVEGVSLWLIVILGLIMGFSCGLLGVGGGFIIMPCFIYVIGCPTMVAIGTSLFQMMFLSAIGAFRHSFVGNVDPVLVVGLLVGSSVGSQFGAALTRRIKDAKLRLLLGTLLFAAVLFVIGNLMCKLSTA